MLLLIVAFFEEFLNRSYGAGCRLHSVAIHDKAMKAVRDSAYDDQVPMARPIYEKLRQCFQGAHATIAGSISTLSKSFVLSMSDPVARR